MEAPSDHFALVVAAARNNKKKLVQSQKKKMPPTDQSIKWRLIPGSFSWMTEHCPNNRRHIHTYIQTPPLIYELLAHFGFILCILIVFFKFIFEYSGKSFGTVPAVVDISPFQHRTPVKILITATGAVCKHF